MSAKVIKLIQTTERTGVGKEDDPVRLCPQLWTLDGLLVAEYDPHTKEYSFRSNNLDIEY